MNLIKQGLAIQAATLAADKAREEARIKELSEESGLSTQEIALLPRETVERPECILEEEVSFSILGGYRIRGVLRAYGRYCRGYRGSREEPAEPAGYEISDVTLNLGGSEETIYCALGPDELEEVAKAAEEE